MAKWLQQIEQWIGKGSNGSTRIKAFRWLLLLGLTGAALLLYGTFQSGGGGWPKGTSNVSREPPAAGVFDGTEQSASSTPAAPGSFESVEMTFEARVKSILEEIVGVGQVDVLVTIDSTEEIVVQRNFKDNQQLTDESDANGGKRHTTQHTRDGEIVMYESTDGKTPIVTKRIKPKVRGVVVVAKGAENAVVKSLIVDAVEKGLNVPAYRISVVPRKIAE
ncbi:stage III sporulation protein AG [Paenibacillus thiaminolyticus]|uniref:stage III sporulation protein AG n=1 Tax=Paenibacillus thiaminolyticus TaxID=49283 RepID=UPI001164820B|nr:stage III sporulation protein AG [Paenibacillus thiaminolyticus]MDG0875160.1 stage III sporulation protein AG [Paenibacillus thiaminolyticus]NGP57047.1 stage III sporulation protein AG [Paenibacillus thiaminolyticus]WCR27758.1 stage III sporulation protein AG [Paenibacillus thiaminolyticus]